MIYTVTFNPSLDYIVRVEDFQPGTINRTCYEEVLEGGKGINVTVVLNNLGIKSTALGFVAGFTGQQVENGIRARGCQTDFIHVDQGLTRINVKLKSREETEINGQGPDIQESHIQQLFARLDRMRAGDILVLSGSIPNTLPEDMYERVMERLQGRGVQIIADATRELLLNVLKYHPFLIKPNNHELGEMFGVELKSREEIVRYGRKLQERGARNILISMAADGAIFISEDGAVYDSPAPEGKLVNSVGAGDSMVAGFLAGYLKENDFNYAFKMGIATGSASAFSEQLATKDEAEALLASIL